VFYEIEKYTEDPPQSGNTVLPKILRIPSEHTHADFSLVTGRWYSSLFSFMKNLYGTINLPLRSRARFFVKLFRDILILSFLNPRFKEKFNKTEIPQCFL
jgi:hypothetical protein